jgi:hypothetical protein
MGTTFLNRSQSAAGRDRANTPRGKKKFLSARTGNAQPPILGIRATMRIEAVSSSNCSQGRMYATAL